jgi:hypothetical protein
VTEQGVVRSRLYALRGLARKCAAGAAILLLCMAVVVAGLEALWWFGRPPTIRDITAGFFRDGLPDSKNVYRRRVRATFPTGIPETELLTLLAQHGYEIKGVNGLGRRYARIHDTLFLLCFVDWGVYWRADNAGTVSEVEDDVLRSACSRSSNNSNPDTARNS